MFTTLVWKKLWRKNYVPSSLLSNLSEGSGCFYIKAFSKISFIKVWSIYISILMQQRDYFSRSNFIPEMI